MSDSHKVFLRLNEESEAKKKSFDKTKNEKWKKKFPSLKNNYKEVII